MKKAMISLFCAVMCLLALAGCGSSGKSTKYAGQVLNVYNWGEYVGENVISNFEKEYDVTVNYSLFSSNEEMYTKLMSGSSYDILVPSDYMIERLISEKMLQPIDKSIVTNLDNLADGVKNLNWDPDNTYAVPYFWGNVGIVYDSTHISQADVEKYNFAIFKQTAYKGHVDMYDSERDAFMIAFKDLGYSMNTSNEEEIQAAYKWLKEMNAAVNPSYVTDESIDDMVNGQKWLALLYSGDASYVLSQNANMRYYAPSYGTNLWVDGMVIPANASNPELANVFINYILTYEASLDNSETVGYSSSNKQVLEELSSEGGTYYNNAAYLPRTDNPKDETFHNNEVLRKELSNLWVKVKLG
mgnify:CR=1 FL=1